MRFIVSMTDGSHETLDGSAPSVEDLWQQIRENKPVKDYYYGQREIVINPANVLTISERL